MTKISAVIITLNKEPCIEQTLRSLDFCDEILVVDSGSTDNTVPLCKENGCKVLHRKFDGYGTQKRFAVEQAANDWILAIDADEVLSPELREEIISAFSHAPMDLKGFFVPISLVFLERVIRFGGEYKKPHLRLFNKKSGTFNTNAVHEGVVLQGATATFKNHILHCSYRNIHHYLEKFNSYTTAAAQSLLVKKRKGAAFQSIVRLPLTFIKIYLFKGCILDGYPGFVWSILSSFYPVIKFMKLYELYRKNPQIDEDEQ